MKTKTLLDALRTAAKLCGGRDLGGVSRKIHILSKDGSTLISSDDREAAITVKVDGSLEGDVDAVLEPKPLIAWLSDAGEDVKVKQTEAHLHLSSGRSRTKVAVIDLPWPQRPAESYGPVWEIDTADVKRAVRLCKSASDEGIQAGCRGEEGILFSATDGRRAAYCPVSAITDSSDDETQILLTPSTLSLIAEASVGVIRFQFSESGVIAVSDSATITSSGLHGGRVRNLPYDGYNMIPLTPRELLPAIRQATCVGSEVDDVTLTFSDDSIKVSLSASGGESEATVDIAAMFDGEITLSPVYLSEAFRAFGLDEPLELGFISSEAPLILIKDDGENVNRYFLAPRCH